MTREERDNALKVLKNYDLNFHKINGMLFSAEEIANAFDMAIKALEQEPRKGHWIPRNSFLLQYKCSECGLESEKYNYCPNCGADMREEVEK